MSGLRGVQGVVRKTASDDLQTDIWESQHMEKIVPSLLFNMHDNRWDTHILVSVMKQSEHHLVLTLKHFKYV